MEITMLNVKMGGFFLSCREQFVLINEWLRVNSSFLQRVLFLTETSAMSHQMPPGNPCDHIYWAIADETQFW